MSVIALRSDAPSLDEEAHKETIAHPFDPFVKTGRPGKVHQPRQTWPTRPKLCA